MVGQDVAEIRIHDDARSGAGDFSGTVRDIRSEEPPERIIGERVTLLHGLADANVDDGRGYPLDEGRQAGHRLAIDSRRHLRGDVSGYDEQDAGDKQT